MFNTTWAQLIIEPSSGITFANFIIDPDPELSVSELKPGFRFGVNLNLGVGKNGFLSSGIQYIQKGDKSRYDDFMQTVYLRYNYLVLPITYKYNLLNIGKVRLQAFGGGYIAVLVGQRLITDFGTYKTIYDKSVSKDFIEKRSDAGILAGVSFIIPVGMSSVTTIAQYERGLININQNFDSVNTNSFSFSVGYLIKLNKKVK